MPVEKVSATTPIINPLPSKSEEKTVTTSAIPDKKLSDSAKLMIGATLLAGTIAIGIIGHKNNWWRRTNKGITSEPAPTKPPEAPKPPEVSQGDDVISEEVKPPIETLNEIKGKILSKALSLNDFKLFGKFDKDKHLAVLNNGVLYTGAIKIDKGNDKLILLEYKNGKIVESTNIVNRKSTTGESPRVRKIKHYDETGIKRIEDIRYGKLTGDYELFSRDKNGSRVIEQYFDNAPAWTSTISAKDGKVIDKIVYDKDYPSDILERTTSYFKNGKQYETIMFNEPEIICRATRVVKDGKVQITKVKENTKTGVIKKLVPFTERVEAHNGLPAYEIRCKGRFNETKELVVLNENNSVKYIKNLNNKNEHVITLNGTSNFRCHGDIVIKHSPEYNTNTIKINSYELYMNKENPNEIIFHGCDESTMKTGGTYNVKTGEINGGYYKIDDRIKNIIRELFGDKKPQNIDKMYEEYSSVIGKIQKELETPENLNIIRTEHEIPDDELWHL